MDWVRVAGKESNLRLWQGRRCKMRVHGAALEHPSAVSVDVTLFRYFVCRNAARERSMCRSSALLRVGGPAGSW